MGNFDWEVFTNNIWLRENAQGLQGIEGKGGYKNGKYYPYITANGNTDIGPGLDLDKQDEAFKKRAAKGFTKQELDSILKTRLQNERKYFNQRIDKEGGDTTKLTDDVYAGLLDMQWQLGNRLYHEYPNFWKAVAKQDYEGMRRESLTNYKNKKGELVPDLGRWEFRKHTYFHDPKQSIPLQATLTRHPEGIISNPNNPRPSFFTRVKMGLEAAKETAPRGAYGRWEEGGQLPKVRLWDDLSLTEKAEMIGVAVKNGITTLPEIRAKYNEFAEGGPTDPPVDPLVAPLDVDLNLDPIGYEMPQEEEPVMKVSAKLADEVIAAPRTFTSADAKNDIRDFYVNDFTQRRQKYHPTETPTQVGNLFDNAHVEFGDIRTGVGGTYNSGNITVSKRLSDNSKRSTVAHEMRHLMDDQLGGLTPEESQILHDAYNLKAGKGYQYLEDEYPTTNTELRYQISRDFNNATGEDLNKIIQGLPDDNLIDRASWVNGYNQISDKILTPKNDKQRLEQKRKADAIRKALMEVAFNPAQTPFNYAAEGGSIHIKPSKKGTFTAAASRHGKSVQEFASQVLAHPENYSPAMRKKANFARNARKWKHELGGPLVEAAIDNVNLYGFGDWLDKTYNKVNRAVEKGRKVVRDLGLDKDPSDHLIDKLKEVDKKAENIRPKGNNDLGFLEKSALTIAKAIDLDKRYKGSDSDTHYRQNLFNLVDPTSNVPMSVEEVLDYARVAEDAKSDNNYKYYRVYQDAAADAAWAKRLGLPYDSDILIDNPDGSVHLAKYLEDEMPTDTTFLKNRIAENERPKSYGAKRQAINRALKYDNEALNNLRYTYQTGKPVEMNEHSHMSRGWISNGEVNYGITPLSLLKRYTFQYDKNNNRMNYWDTYDFDEFEDFVPGNPFFIRGSIDLNSRK